MKKELKTIDQDKEHIQNIFTSKTHKQAIRRYNTLYNKRTQLNTHIKHFLEKIKPELDIILNHTIDEDIPRTNNTVENYYRTTQPRSQKKNLQNTKRTKKNNKTHANTLDTQKRTKRNRQHRPILIHLKKNHPLHIILPPHKKSPIKLHTRTHSPKPHNTLK